LLHQFGILGKATETPSMMFNSVFAVIRYRCNHRNDLPLFA
jgi:hypothetical protein